MNQAITDATSVDGETRVDAIRLMNETRARVLELERQVTRLNAQIAAVTAENEMNRARVVQVRTSLSWRITRPLRRARRLFARRIGGRK